MTTETIERTPAQQRKEKADEQVKKLEAEQTQLQARKQAVHVDASRLQDAIATAERAGADLKTLAALRRDRVDQEQTNQDLDRVLSVIDQELVPARAQLEDAEKACKAEKYNAIVEKQRALARVIDEAVATILETIKVKQSLAGKQDTIHGDVGCPNPELSPMGIRTALRQAITSRLDGDEAYGTLPPFSQIDWSCRQMADGGNLLRVE